MMKAIDNAKIRWIIRNANETLLIPNKKSKKKYKNNKKYEVDV